MNTNVHWPDDHPVNDDAYNEASRLAVSMYIDFYAGDDDAVGFYLCDSTAGVISQIDNMVTGLVRGPL